MSADSTATWLLEQETRALLTRLASVQPFVLQETYLAAAALSPAALSGIEQFLIAGRRDVHRRAEAFLAWLRGPGATAPAAEKQRRFWMLRLAFQDALSQFDLFSEVVTQRSEHGNGVLLSGLDVAAAEALLVPGGFFEGPPVVCSLHRRAGRRHPPRADQAAWRGRQSGRADPDPARADDRLRRRVLARARGRAPGRGASAARGVAARPAAAAPPADAAADGLGPAGTAWVSEIVADFWSISRIGIGSTLGLIGLVSLPRAFVFRPSDDDPHPMPWIRVLLSCAIGDRLYPDPQWKRLAATWRAMYPLAGLRPALARDHHRAPRHDAGARLDHH